MELILYIFYVAIIILMVIGCACIGYDLGSKDTENAFRNKKCDKCLNYKTHNCPNANECYSTFNKPYFKV